jgi:hypothetical protein
MTDMPFAFKGPMLYVMSSKTMIRRCRTGPVGILSNLTIGIFHILPTTPPGINYPAPKSVQQVSRFLVNCSIFLICPFFPAHNEFFFLNRRHSYPSVRCFMVVLADQLQGDNRFTTTGSLRFGFCAAAIITWPHIYERPSIRQHQPHWSISRIDVRQ